MRRGLEILGWLTAILLFAFASPAALAQTASPQQRQQRVRRTSEADDVSPASIVREARTLYVSPRVRVDKKYLEYKLQKYTELRDWGLSIVEDERAADLILNVDQKTMNYIFSITDPRTSIVVVSGKVVAINDPVAAEYLGKEIIKKIKDVRASADRTPSKRKHRDDDDEPEESESNE